MLVIGLIGKIAAGKSTVAARFASHGGQVIDADQLAHDVLEEPGARAEIVAEAEQNPAGFAAWLRRERVEIRAIADRAGIKPE